MVIVWTYGAIDQSQGMLGMGQVMNWSGTIGAVIEVSPATGDFAYRVPRVERTWRVPRIEKSFRIGSN